jgi:hypothetical protein
MQPARGGQIKTIGIAVDLQENHREFPQPDGLLGDPESIEKFWRLCDEKLIQRKPRKCREAGSVGKAHLGKSLAGSNPENWTPQTFPLSFTAIQDQSGHSPGKASHRATIAQFAAMNLGQAGGRQAATQGIIQVLNTCREKTGSVRSRNRAPQSRRCRGCQQLGLRAFDLRDFLTQGKNSRLRHGVVRHDGCFRVNVLFMFLWIPEDCWRVKHIAEEFIPVR